MLPISIKYILLIAIAAQIHISSQLNFMQNKIKDTINSSTKDLDPKMRIELADYLKSAVGIIPGGIIPAVLRDPVVKNINEVLDEYKSDTITNMAKKTGPNSPLPNLADLEYIYGNVFANKIQQNMSEEELNRFMKSINEKEQSSKMSSARYLTIHLENQLKKVAEQFTQRFEKLVTQLTNETINDIKKQKNVQTI